MNNWFSWNGQNSLEYGIRVTRQPELTIAQERVTWEKVTGRSGSVTMLEGESVYDDITMSAECMIDDLTALGEAMAWLQGKGMLGLPIRPGGYYIGRLSQQISLARVITAREDRRFTLVWRCEPFFYLTPDEDIELTEAGRVVNPSVIPSQPRITVYGTGDVILVTGGTVVGLTGLTDGIILDSELVDALDLEETQLVNEKVTGEFPVFGAGATNISWEADPAGEGGSVTKVVIEPRWRTL